MPSSLVIAGYRINAARSTVASADQLFRTGARGLGATLAADSRCYFVVDAFGELTGMSCGPVRFPGDGGTGWQNFEVDIAGRSGKTVSLVAKVDPAVDRSPSPDGVRWLRPDRKQPPTNELLAAPASVLDPSTVQTLSDPGVEFRSPADGRLRGAGLALVVTGAAETETAGAGDARYVAGPGRHLLVFSLHWVGLPDAEQQQPGAGTLGIVVDGQRTAIAPSVVGNDPTVLVVSVPAAAKDVALELSAAGYAQRFSLLTLTRQDPSPTVMYRDAAGPDVISDVHAEKVVTLTDTADGVTAPMTLSIDRVWLSWFDPNGQTPTDPGQAILAVQGSAIGNNTGTGSQVDWLTDPYPTDHVHLVLPDGTRLTASHARATHSSSLSSSLLAGTYFFTVPADLTAAQLVFAPIATPGSDQYSAPSVPIQVPGSTIPLTLPALPPAGPAVGPPTTLPLTGQPGNATAAPAVGAASAPASERWGGSAHGSRVSIVLLLGVAAITAAGAGLTGLRGRRRRPPNADPHTPIAAACPEDVGHVTGADESVDASGTADTKPSPGDLQSAITVRVLGPVEIDGVTAPLTAPEMELLAFLALHPDRALTLDELRDAMGAGKATEPKADSVMSYVSRLRKTIGTDRLPRGGTYQLAGVTSDWAEFQRLVTAACQTTDSTHAASLMARACSLLRGVPFAGAPFGWVDGPLLTSIEQTIVEATSRLADLNLELGDPQAAANAVTVGLNSIRYPDERLLERQLQAAARGGPGPLTAAFRDATARLAAQDEAPSAALLANYDHLRQQHAAPPREDRSSSR